MSDFRERLKELIKNKSLRQIGRESGISASSLSLYLKGDREPTMNAINQLAEYFNVSTDFILGNTNQQLPSNIFELEQNARRIPVFTAAGAGGGKVTNEDVIDMVDSKTGDFGVRVEGDSMEPEIFDGDTVIIKRVNSLDEIEDGEMVVVRINNNEAMLKYIRFDYESEHVILYSQNRDYSPKFVSLKRFKCGESEVVGKVIEKRSTRIAKG